MAHLGKPPPSSEITPEPLYFRRREFMRNAVLSTVTAAGVGGGLLWLMGGQRAGRKTAAAGAADEEVTGADLSIARRGTFGVDEPPTRYDDVTSYNNFYEFGTGKSDPAENAHTLRPRPWTVAIGGEVGKPQTVDVDRLLGWFPLEERVYRMRCVEAWSMVVPWSGFAMKAFVELAKPLASAKYVVMKTFKDPKVAPGQRAGWFPWPYTEGLTIEEATNETGLGVLAIAPLAGRMIEWLENRFVTQEERIGTRTVHDTITEHQEQTFTVMASGRPYPVTIEHPVRWKRGGRSLEARDLLPRR